MELFKKNIDYVNADYYAETNIGRVRLSNEDNVTVVANSKGQYLMVVCDGMGGANKGDYASKITIDMLVESFNDKPRFLSEHSAFIWLANMIKKINSKLYDDASKSPDYHGMGTTLTAVMLVNNHLIVGQIGDSRAYLVKDGKLEQITEDQSYVGYLYRTGQIKKEEIATHPKRNLLTNAVGNLPSINIDIRIYPYRKEKVLLCSDGLYNNVSETTIENILNNSDSAAQKVNELISIANANGGSDNIAIVIWEQK